jgi:amino acid adenylation domain-containing protein
MNTDARESAVQEGLTKSDTRQRPDLASEESKMLGDAMPLVLSQTSEATLVGESGRDGLPLESDLPGFPSTLGQQEFWLAHRYDPSDAAHHEHICARLEGELDGEALEAAIRTVIERHPALRSTFHEVDGIPFQRYAHDTVFILGKLDLGARPPDLKDMAAREALVDFLRKPFDLEREIPIRGLLVILSPRSHILLLVLHHIQTDGASNVQLAVQLSRCYREILLNGRAESKSHSLLALRWGLEERDHLRMPEAARSAEAWRGLLEGYVPKIPWPVSPPGVLPVDARLRPRQLSIPFDENLASQVSSTYGAGSADWYRFLLATYVILLHRITGERRITVGVPVHDRRHPGEKEALGLRMKTVPLCVDVDGCLDLKSFMSALDGALRAAFRHLRTPVGPILRELAGEKSVRPFHSIFNHKEDPVEFLDLPRLIATPLDLPRQGVKADITLTLFRRFRPGLGGQAPLVLNYDPSVFSDQEIVRLADRWLHIQRQCASDPTITVQDIGILLPDEAKRLHELSGIGQRIDFPQSPLYRLFLDQAAHRPTAPAIVSDAGSTTYSELEFLSAAAAAHLLGMGHVPGLPVAVMGARSEATVIALLAVLRTGSPFVSIDAELPFERIGALLRESGVTLCLVAGPTLHPEEWPGVQYIRLPEMVDPSLARDPRIDPPIGPEAGAYILFTSGSTGTPKGALNTHGAITNRIHSMARLIGFGPTDRTLFRSSPGFDVFIPEVFLPLAMGGAIVLPPTPAAPSPAELPALIARHRISYLHLVPSALQTFLESPANPEADAALRVLWCGGEALSGDLARRFQGQWKARLIHGYGHTETAVGVTCYEVAGNWDDRIPPPIGKPLPNVAVLVMDNAGRPVPPGVRGELWVSGVQTGRGYVNDEAATAERFVANPWGAGSDARWYRTGDLGRFLLDGNLEFLGRMDDQVKVLGQRVEPGEVSAALRACTGVREAMVLPEPDGTGSQRLRAWVSGEGLKEADLRAVLQSRLPGYMVPFRVHMLASWPLTVHGKTDRQALRRMAEEAEDEVLTPLKTATERWLAELWAKRYGLKGAGADADFFRLGGHSLTAMRMLSQVRAEKGLSVTLSELYADARLSSLARRIDAGTGVMNMAPPASGVEGPAPMSYGQRRMWMLQRMMSHPSAYHVTRLLQIPDGLGPAEARRVLEVLARRHGVLRTRLWEQDGRFWQEDLPVDRWEMDWQEQKVSDGEQAAVLSMERERLFDLSSGCLWRARWLEGSGVSGVSRLYLVFHHAVIDEWSMGIFLGEFWRLLRGECKEADLPVVAEGYSDYARWQQRMLDGGERPRLDAYWQERLKGWENMVRFTPDHVVADPEPGRQGNVARDLSIPFRKAVADFAQEEALSPFVVWLTLWQVLFSRISGGRDVLVTTPLSDRGADWQELVGMCLNTIPVMSRIDGGMSFRTLARSVKGSLEQDLAHAALPFEEMFPKDGRGTSADPRVHFQVMFVHRNGSYPGEERTLEEEDPCPPYARRDLTLVVDEQGAKSVIRVQYDAARFRMETIQGLLMRYVSVARQLLAHPGRPVREVELLLPGESEEVRRLSGILDRMTYPDTTLHGMFRSMVAAYPDSAAILAVDGRVTTYAELCERAARIAACLRVRGMGRDHVAAIHAGRTPDLLASMLGVMEAGGAFLLLEPGMPVERSLMMLRQADVHTVLAGDRVPELKAFADKTVPIRSVWEASDSADGNASSSEDPSSLAYVMFTSGSTGVPRGAMVEHRHILNRLLFTRDALSFGRDDRTLLKSPLSFDVCLTELLLPLMTGGAVVLGDPFGPMEMPRVADLVERHGVTYLHFVPSMLRAFLDVPGVQRVNGILRMIRCGGESLPDDLMRRCLSTLDAVLWQSYGPAETAVAVTLWKCHNGHGHPKPPIGRPNANVDILIMDPEGRPLPPGMPGEMWIGGAQTGRGYIHNEEETRKRFVSDPIEPGSGRSYYRSGDLAKFLPDGNLLFLGRADDQLKVRGVRIEPGDVTSALLRCAGVREAVVLAEPDGEGSHRLRAWVTLGKGVDADESTLRSSLLLLLPGYMVPFRIHVVERIPLTPHGKTDHRALRTIAEATGDGVQPLHTPTERKLADLWSELMGVEVLNSDADFFRLGGHSLMALRLSAAIQKAFGVIVTLPEYYSHPLLKELAARIDAGCDDTQESLPLPEMPASDTGGPVPMSGSQRRLWMLQRMMAHPSAYHVARLLQMPEGVSARKVRGVLEVLARRHGVLRVRLWEEGGAFWQEEVPVGEWRMEWREVYPADRGEASFMAEEWERLFDLSSGPLWRACWMQGSGESRLYLVFHHSVTDEWSMGIFLGEFWRLLLGECREEDLPVSQSAYGDYAIWQRRLLVGEPRQRLDAYWRERLRGWEDMVRLTPDHIVADPEAGRQEKVERALEPSCCRDLSDFARNEGVSLFVVLLGAWQVLLARLTGGTDILVGTPVSDRRRPEWQDVMGMILNIVPVRMDVDLKIDFRSHCRRLKREMESVLEHALLPYSDISLLASRDRVNPFRSIVQILFTCVGAEGAGAYPDRVVEAEHSVPKYAGDDIFLVVDIRQDAWRVRMHYDASRFDGRRMSSLLDRYMGMLELIRREASSPLGELSMLVPDEKNRLIVLGMGTHQPFPDRPLIDRLFDGMVEARPDAPAVEHAGTHATYAELRVWTDAWAGRLSRADGIVAGDVIALLLPSGISHVVLLFACWKVGASVVPIDPELPADRIRYMLEDSGCRFVVCASGHRGHLTPDHVWVDVEADSPIGTLPPARADRDPSGPAYLMYTSGSTGLPKGTYNTHLGFVNTVLSVSRTLGMTSDDRVAQFSSPSFDVSVFEICLAFFNGATLVVPERKELSVLPSFIMGKRVSVAMLTPMVIGSLDAGTLSHVRALMTGGEEARPHDMARLSGVTSLFNIYGTTEACVWSTIHPVGRWEDPTRRVPLGRPFDNVFACILDAGLRLVPTGGVGELCVGGPGLPSGYHRKPMLSAERFIPDPFHPGRMLYRTGDLARWDDEGRLCYLGRMDGQVKVNGHRVETAEVVASLEAVDGIACAAVIHRSGQGQESGLVAFLVMEEGRVLDETGLRAELSQRLPGHMLPVRCLTVDHIPLNPNGKVDKPVLLNWDDKGLEEREQRVRSGVLPKPDTQTERRLAGIWSQILGIETIHADDSFFSLGGNSLQLIRLMDQITSEWGIPVDPSGIFIHPTLRAMARLLDDLSHSIRIEGRDKRILPVDAWDTGSGRHLFAMVGGAGSVSEFTKYHRIGSFLGEAWRVHILPDPDASHGRFPKMGPAQLAERYAELVLPVASREKVWLLGDCIGGIDAFALACALQSSGVQDIGLILMDVAAPAPSTRVPSSSPSAFDRYYMLPERQDPLREGLHDMLLPLLRMEAAGLLFHPVPSSRRQAFRMAVALGLFDPSEYLASFPEAGPSDEDAFRHYMDRGWKEGAMPSAGFNPYRYRKIVDGFHPGADEPVLHALFFGMRVRYVRRKVMDSIKRPRQHSDLMAARTMLRREMFSLGVFRGDLHLVMSGRVFLRGTDLGWSRHVEGKVHLHRAEGDHRTYLKEELDATASILKGILSDG